MSPETWTVLTLLTWATKYFTSHHIHPPRPTAEILLAHVLGCKRIDLYIHYDRPLNPRELASFKTAIQRRLKGEPVAYIVGERGFWSLDLDVTPDVLIPRPETEIVVETALDILPHKDVQRPQKILDLGTGSGAILLALAMERPGHLFYGIDRSPRALRVARGNARKHGLEDEVHFLCGNWFDPLAYRQKGFHLIVSNPPYIRRSEVRHLAPEISKYEPPRALDGGRDGLDAVRVLIQQAHKFIIPSGWLIFEIGYDQGEDAKRLMEESEAYVQISVVKDYGGHDRVVQGMVEEKLPLGSEESV